MLFSLSPAEMLRIVRDAEEMPDGTFVVSIPASRLIDSDQPPVAPFTFDSRHNIMARGGLSVRLSPIEFRLAQYVSEHGRTPYETLQDAVWGKHASDDTIRMTCGRASARIIDAGFGCELVANRSHVSLQPIG